MPAELGRHPIVLGLWKGDLTLKRAIVSAMGRMQRDGELATIMARYIPDDTVVQDGVQPLRHRQMPIDTGKRGDACQKCPMGTP